jgi:hypothetical protein
MLLRLLHWALRIPVIPQGHEPGCEAGITKPLGCKCAVQKLRPPRLGEAVVGLY